MEATAEGRYEGEDYEGVPQTRVQDTVGGTETNEDGETGEVTPLGAGAWEDRDDAGGRKLFEDSICESFEDIDVGAGSAGGQGRDSAFGESISNSGGGGRKKMSLVEKLGGHLSLARISGGVVEQVASTIELRGSKLSERFNRGFSSDKVTTLVSALRELRKEQDFKEISASFEASVEKLQGQYLREAVFAMLRRLISTYECTDAQAGILCMLMATRKLGLVPESMEFPVAVLSVRFVEGYLAVEDDKKKLKTFFDGIERGVVPGGVSSGAMVGIRRLAMSAAEEGWLDEFDRFVLGWISIVSRTTSTDVDVGKERAKYFATRDSKHDLWQKVLPGGTLENVSYWENRDSMAVERLLTVEKVSGVPNIFPEDYSRVKNALEAKLHPDFVEKALKVVFKRAAGLKWTSENVPRLTWRQFGAFLAKAWELWEVEERMGYRVKTKGNGGGGLVTVVAGDTVCRFFRRFGNCMEGDKPRCDAGTHPAKFRKGTGLKVPGGPVVLALSGGGVKPTPVQAKQDGRFVPPVPMPKGGAPAGVAGKVQPPRDFAGDPKDDKPVVIVCRGCQKRFEEVPNMWKQKGLHVPMSCRSCLEKKREERRRDAMLVEEFDEAMVVEEEAGLRVFGGLDDEEGDFCMSVVVEEVSVAVSIPVGGDIFDLRVAHPLMPQVVKVVMSDVPVDFGLHHSAVAAAVRRECHTTDRSFVKLVTRAWIVASGGMGETVADAMEREGLVEKLLLAVGGHELARLDGMMDCLVVVADSLIRLWGVKRAAARDSAWNKQLGVLALVCKAGRDTVGTMAAWHGGSRKARSLVGKQKDIRGMLVEVPAFVSGVEMVEVADHGLRCLGCGMEEQDCSCWRVVPNGKGSGNAVLDRRLGMSKGALLDELRLVSGVAGGRGGGGVVKGGALALPLVNRFELISELEEEDESDESDGVLVSEMVEEREEWLPLDDSMGYDTDEMYWALEDEDLRDASIRSESGGVSGSVDSGGDEEVRVGADGACSDGEDFR